MGTTSRSALQNDAVVEVMQYVMNEVAFKVTKWKVYKFEDPPEDSDDILEIIRMDLLERLSYIRTMSEEEEGKKFLFDDQVRKVSVNNIIGLFLTELFAEA